MTDAQLDALLEKTNVRNMLYLDSRDVRALVLALREARASKRVMFCLWCAQKFDYNGRTLEEALPELEAHDQSCERNPTAKALREAREERDRFKAERADGLYGVARVAKLIETYQGIEQCASQAEAEVARLRAEHERLKAALRNMLDWRCDDDGGPFQDHSVLCRRCEAASALKATGGQP